MFNIHNIQKNSANRVLSGFLMHFNNCRDDHWFLPLCSLITSAEISGSVEEIKLSMGSFLLLMKNTYPKIYDIPEMKHDCRHCSFQTSIQRFLISPVVGLANDWELEFDNWQLTSSKINNSPCVGIQEQLRQWKHWGWVGERCRDKLWSMKERAGVEWTQITDWLPTPQDVNEW